MGKESTIIVGDTGFSGSVPGSGRCPGRGNGNPLQYSCLKNPMDRRAWQAKRSHRGRHCWVTKHRIIIVTTATCLGINIVFFEKLVMFWSSLRFLCFSSDGLQMVQGRLASSHPGKERISFLCVVLYRLLLISTGYVIFWTVLWTSSSRNYSNSLCMN